MKHIASILTLIISLNAVGQDSKQVDHAGPNRVIRVGTMLKRSVDTTQGILLVSPCDTCSSRPMKGYMIYYPLSYLNEHKRPLPKKWIVWGFKEPSE